MTTAAIAQPPVASTSNAAAFLKAGLTGGAIAAAANVTVYGVARIAGVDFVAQMDPAQAAQQIPFVMPIVSSLLPSVVASFIMLGFAKFLQKPVTPFIALSALFTLVSLGGPLNLAGATLATKLALTSMHFIAAAAIVTTLVRAAQRGGGGESR